MRMMMVSLRVGSWGQLLSGCSVLCPIPLLVLIIKINPNEISLYLLNTCYALGTALCSHALSSLSFAIIS